MEEREAWASRAVERVSRAESREVEVAERESRRVVSSASFRAWEEAWEVVRARSWDWRRGRVVVCFVREAEDLEREVVRVPVRGVRWQGRERGRKDVRTSCLREVTSAFEAACCVASSVRASSERASLAESLDSSFSCEDCSLCLRSSICSVVSWFL